MGLAAVDLGKLNKGDKREFGLVVYNDSNNHVHTTTWASCGCTKPVLTPEVIPPGGTGILTIKYDSTGRSGIQEKMFGINYKHEDKPYGISITLKANI